MNTTTKHLRELALWMSAIAAVTGLPVLGNAPVVGLGPDLIIRCGSPSLPLTPGPNTALADLQGTPAMVPGGEGPAATFAAPKTAFGTKQGMIGMQLIASKRIEYSRDGSFPRMVLLNCPALRVELWAQKDCPQLRVSVLSREKQSTRICRIAYLKPDQWYHFAVSWDAVAGRVELFVNGWAQQRIHFEPWQYSVPDSPQIEIGGMLGNGDGAIAIAVCDVTFSQWFHDEARLRTTLSGKRMQNIGSEVRQGYDMPLDLSRYELEEVERPDFRQALPLITEEALFDGDRRVREPKPGQWVLEGPGKAYTKNGELVMVNPESGPDHLVLWLPRPYPENVLIEFEITLERPDDGLAIVFFAAQPCSNPQGSIFTPGLAMRHGNFAKYIRGDINSYHVSYLAADQSGQGIFGPRRTANVRKNSGFWLVACGDDQIQGKGMGAGPHPVRILKIGNQIRVEANHRLSVTFDDDGKTWGPVWGDGYVGLRQMNNTRSARYRNLAIYFVRKK